MLEKVNSSYKYLFVAIAQLCIIGVSLVVPVFCRENSFLIVVSFDTLITASMIFFLLNLKNKKNHIKIPYFILLLFIGISFIFNGIYYNVIGYIAIGLIFAVIIPLLNLAFSMSSKFSVCKALASGIIFSFLMFFLISICCGPALGMAQYTSFFSNPNTLGSYMIIVVSASIFLILDAVENNKKSKFLYYMVFAFAISIAVYTNSRTSMIAIFAQILFVSIFFVIFYIKKCDYSSIKKFFKKVVLLGLLVLISFSFSFFLLTSVKIELIKSFPSIQVTTDYDKITIRDGLARMGTRYTKGLDGDNKNDEFTSGRKEIWGTFIKNISLKGHKEEGLKVVEDKRFYQKTNAHNVYLQMAYSAGLLTGIAMLALMILAAKDLLKKIIEFLKAGQIDKEAVFTMCAALSFAVFSLTSGGYMVFTYLPTTMFYFLLYTITVKKKTEID